MLVSYLRAMETTEQPRVLSWAFELAYLELSGIGPVTDRCPACGEVSLGGVYVASHGGTLCPNCAPGDVSALEVSAETARTIEAMRRFDADSIAGLRPANPTRHQVQRLIRDHIRYHLDLNLKSEQFVEGLGRWRPPPRRARIEGDPSGGASDDE